MIANYHTHTWRCNHAEPDEISYVEAALRRGLTILGFSDHAPYPFPSGYYSNFRMRVNQLDDYCRTVTALQKRYAGQLQIELGLEAEYYPRYFSDFMAMLRDTPIDYMLLGQHFTRSETDGVYSGAATADKRDLLDYCAQCRDAMQTGLYTYFAHPDLIHFVGSDRLYRKEMAALFREAKQCGVPLEINLLGLSSGRHYPSERYLELVAQEGCDIVLGIDAHSASALSDTAPETRAKAMLARFGLTPLKTIELKHIHKVVSKNSPAAEQRFFSASASV